MTESVRIVLDAVTVAFLGPDAAAVKMRVLGEKASPGAEMTSDTLEEGAADKEISIQPCPPATNGDNAGVVNVPRNKVMTTRKERKLGVKYQAG